MLSGGNFLQHLCGLQIKIHDAVVLQQFNSYINVYKLAVNVEMQKNIFGHHSNSNIDGTKSVRSEEDESFSAK